MIRRPEKPAQNSRLPAPKTRSRQTSGQKNIAPPPDSQVTPRIFSSWMTGCRSGLTSPFPPSQITFFLVPSNGFQVGLRFIWLLRKVPAPLDANVSPIGELSPVLVPVHNASRRHPRPFSLQFSFNFSRLISDPLVSLSVPGPPFSFPIVRSLSFFSPFFCRSFHEFFQFIRLYQRFFLSFIQFPPIIDLLAPPGRNINRLILRVIHAAPPL